jgi:hypothetical protein
MQDNDSGMGCVSLFLERRDSYTSGYRERPTMAATTAPKKALDATLMLMELAALRLELPLALTMVVVPFEICVPARPIAPVIELRLANPTLGGSARKIVYTFLRNESPTTQVG